VDLQLPVQSVPITTPSCEFEPHSWRDVLDTTLFDKVCQWFFLGTVVSSINKTDLHDITEILLKVGLNTITQTLSIHHSWVNPNKTPCFEFVL
jgi:hypothetical protein